MKRTLLAALAILAIAAAACSSDQGNGSTEPSEAVTPSAEASEAAESEAALPSISGVAMPSFDTNGDPELADRFPDTVGGQTLQMASMRGDQMSGAGGVDPAFQEFLDSIDAEMTDVSVAFGFILDPEDPTGGFGASAFRVLGASEDELEQGFVTATQEGGEVGGSFEAATVGGKDVLTAPDADPDGPATYLYTKDDTVYFLTGAEDLAAEVLEALP